MYIVLGKVLVTNDEGDVRERDVVLLTSENQDYAKEWSEKLKMAYSEEDEIFDTFGPDVRDVLEANEDHEYEGLQLLTILSVKVLPCPSIPSLSERMDSVITALEDGKSVPSHEIVALLQDMHEKIPEE